MRIRPRSTAILILAGLSIAAVPTAAFASFGAGKTNAGNSISAASIAPVTGVTATVQSSTSIKISWHTPTQTVDNVSYEVLDTTNSTNVCTAPVTPSCTDTGVLPGQTYSFTVRAFVSSTSWTNDVTTSATTPDVYALSPTTAQTAGSPFTLTVTAKKATSPTNGTLIADTSYAGTSISFSGPSSSPNGTAPTYNGSTSTSATVSFAAGQATVAVALYNAASTTLTATTGSGGTAVIGTDTFTVNNAGILLSFSGGCSSFTTKKNTGSTVTISRATTDQYGNADPNAGNTVSLALSGNNGSWNPAGPVNLAGTTSGNETWKNINTSGVSATPTASAAGYTAVSCTYNTTP
jgi:Fibronectin type III domain